MSKITFRADDDLVERLEEFDASKSEVMREALRSYLDGGGAGEGETSVDDALAERVDELVAERLGRATASPRSGRDINVNVTLDGASVAKTATEPGRVGAGSGSETGVDARETDSGERKTEGTPDGVTREGAGAGSQTRRKTCGGCGENVAADHVYCPNCGEKASHRVFCDCGDELRSDWAFCPSCGRRTPAADVLEGT
jgi:predicted transcriptional regulator